MTDFNSDPIRVSANNGLWYVLHHRSEPRTVALMLEDFAAQGFEAYLPQLLRYRRVMRGRVRTGERQWVAEPLFRGYILVRRNPGAEWGPKPMNRVYGVEGVPIGTLPHGEIVKLRAEESRVSDLVGLVAPDSRRYLPENGFVPVDQWRAALKRGDRVEIEVLAGTDRYIAGIVEANEAGRLRILADMLGQFSVDLPRRVRPVEVAEEVRQSA